MGLTVLFTHSSIRTLVMCWNQHQLKHPLKVSAIIFLMTTLAKNASREQIGRADICTLAEQNEHLSLQHHDFTQHYWPRTCRSTHSRFGGTSASRNSISRTSSCTESETFPGSISRTTGHLSFRLNNINWFFHNGIGGEALSPLTSLNMEKSVVYILKPLATTAFPLQHYFTWTLPPPSS